MAKAIPRPEHPRPDFERAGWINLNGDWEFEIDSGNSGAARGLISGTRLQGAIVAPFCPESPSSGVANPAISGLCYTQLTDVEQEVNGLYTFARKPKFAPETIAKIVKRKAAIE